MGSQVQRAAWAAGGANACGLVLAVVGMRPGAPMRPLAERLEFVASAPLGWTLGWSAWFLAALALTWLFVALLWRRASCGEAWLAEGVALAFVILGAATDLCCDALQITLLPAVARAALASGDPGTFLLLERALWAGGVVCGCGLYCAAVGLLTAARWSLLGALARACGVATALTGAVWVGAELVQARALLEPVTGLCVGAFVGWAWLLPRQALASALEGHPEGVAPQLGASGLAQPAPV